MSQRPGPHAQAAGCALALLAVACASGSGPQPEPQLAAEVGSRRITVEELDRRIRDELFERETRGSASRLYEVREGALDRIIDEALVEAESAKSGVSPEAWIQQETAARGAVTDEEVAAFYAANAQQLRGATLEQATPRIRDHLAAQRAGELIEELRARSDVHVVLAPPRLSVAAVGPSLGPEQARVTIIEFGDFQCPFCQRVTPTLKEVLARYPEDVRVVYRQLPLEMHARARAAAEASLCAHDQGHFWPYHDRLFENPKALAAPDLVRYAGELGLDLPRFQTCVEERAFEDQVQQDLEAARDAGISGTPAFLVNGILLSGARPTSAFVDLIDQELARK
jgi:protein-disulfide isomerase